MELDKLLKEAHEMNSKPLNSSMDNVTKNGSDELKTAPTDFKGYYLTSNNQYLYVKLNDKKYYYQLGQWIQFSKRDEYSLCNLIVRDD